MHKINLDKAQMHIDIVQSYDDLTLRCRVLFPGEELGGACLLLGVTFIMVYQITFWLILLFGFLLVTENKY